MTSQESTRDSSSSDLSELVNIGPAMLGYFQRIGITRISQLAGRDAVEIYEDMCRADRQRIDPCLLDTVMSAVEQSNGGPARPWWDYTTERKRLLGD
ncbi:MAG: mitomycin resistance protein [Acidimicrobiales bacterium]|nr:MAG: mitomycin resistance protein [Acidimicrobiales bacterium]